MTRLKPNKRMKEAYKNLVKRGHFNKDVHTPIELKANVQGFSLQKYNYDK